MNKIKSGRVIVCEYVAQSAYGKHTLVSVYSGDILVQSLPARVPFAFFIELEIEGDGGPTQLKIDVLLGEKSKISADVKIDFEHGKPGVIVLQQSLFQIDEATDLKVKASIDGGRAVTLVRKSINLGVIPA